MDAGGREVDAGGREVDAAMAVGREVVVATRTERLQGAENSASKSVMSGIVSRLRSERDSHASPGCKVH